MLTRDPLAFPTRYEFCRLDQHSEPLDWRRHWTQAGFLQVKDSGFLFGVVDALAGKATGSEEFVSTETSRKPDAAILLIGQSQKARQLLMQKFSDAAVHWVGFCHKGINSLLDWTCSSAMDMQICEANAGHAFIRSQQDVMIASMIGSTRQAACTGSCCMHTDVMVSANLSDAAA